MNNNEMKKGLAYFFVGAILLISACGKYEEGPSLSLRSKKARVANEWRVAYAYDLDDQKDITAEYQNETWEFTKDGQFFERENGELDDAGSWDFINDKEEIAISTGIDIDKFKILRLKENEMWLQDGDEELHLIPNE